MKSFENICKMSQKSLKTYLTKYLKTQYNDVTSSDGFIYAKGTYPVMLVAHMDTVHKDLVKKILYTNEGDIITSPQGIGGDDRCGIYMILKLIETYNCSVLFTEDEEAGCIGATKFVKAYEAGLVDMGPVNYIVELDRKGSNDAVFYECDNPEFEDFILKDKDWKLDWGTYTDIVEIAPALGVAAVNFSCGYYQAHTTKEYVVRSEIEANIEKVKKLLERTTENDWFEYIEAEHYYKGFFSGWNTKTADDYYECCKSYYVAAEGSKGKLIEDEVYAMNETEAIGAFMIEHPEVCYNSVIDILCEDDYI